MTKEELHELTVEELLEMMPKNFAIGKTFFEEPEKRWLCEGYYNPLWEYSKHDGGLNPEQYLTSEFKETAHYYGASVKEVLINTIFCEQN